MSEDNKKLTADQLENVAGGKIASGPKCPKCDIYLDWDGGLGAHKCPACGYYDPSEISKIFFCPSEVTSVMLFPICSITLSSESFFTPHPLISKETTKAPMRRALVFIPFEIFIISILLFRYSIAVLAVD